MFFIKPFLFSLFSFVSGVTNVIFGAGGGIIAVEGFKFYGFDQKNSQATALSAMFIMSLFSSVYYMLKGYFNIKNALIYIPFGIPGAFAGSYLLNKLSDKILKKLFAVLIIWAGARMILQ